MRETRKSIGDIFIKAFVDEALGSGAHLSFRFDGKEVLVPITPDMDWEIGILAKSIEDHLRGEVDNLNRIAEGLIDELDEAKQ